MKSLRVLYSEAVRKGVTLDTELAPDLPVVLADEIQIQQVVFNLLTNAIEAMQTVRHSGKNIIVRTRKSSEEIRVEVQDSGPGLPDSDKVFEAFYKNVMRQGRTHKKPRLKDLW